VIIITPIIAIALTIIIPTGTARVDIEDHPHDPGKQLSNNRSAFNQENRQATSCSRTPIGNFLFQAIKKNFLASIRVHSRLKWFSLEVGDRKS